MTVDTTTPGTLLRGGFAVSEYHLRTNLAGVTQEHAAQPPPAGGNDMLWVVAHITYWRNEMVATLGLAPAWSDPRREAFKGLERKPAAQTAGWQLDDLLSAYDRCTAALTEALPSAPEAVGAGLAKLLAHEGYHVGQLSMLRRLAGLPPPA